MKILQTIVCLFLIGCTSTEDTSSQEKLPSDTSKVNQEETSSIETEEMEVVGIAANRKGGAVVISNTNGEHYWLEGLDSWSEEFHNKEVAVTGQLEERSDAPIFMDTSEIKSQGIPVYNEEQMESQAKRFWIINPSYQLVK